MATNIRPIYYQIYVFIAISNSLNTWNLEFEKLSILAIEIQGINSSNQVNKKENRFIPFRGFNSCFSMKHLDFQK